LPKSLAKHVTIKLMPLRDALSDKRDQILRIAARYGATEVHLIGSVARGEESPDSDIDLLVRWSPTASLLDHAALSLELEQLLGRRVDLASEGWVKPRIRDSVYRDARPL
jgi:predicted nucleotidyltransferase